MPDNDENSERRDDWREALVNTMKHDFNPIFDTVSSTRDLLRANKASHER